MDPIDAHIVLATTGCLCSFLLLVLLARVCHGRSSGVEECETTDAATKGAWSTHPDVDVEDSDRYTMRMCSMSPRSGDGSDGADNDTSASSLGSATPNSERGSWASLYFSHTASAHSDVGSACTPCDGPGTAETAECGEPLPLPPGFVPAADAPMAEGAEPVESGAKKHTTAPIVPVAGRAEVSPDAASGNPAAGLPGHDSGAGVKAPRSLRAALGTNNGPDGARVVGKRRRRLISQESAEHCAAVAHEAIARSRSYSYTGQRRASMGTAATWASEVGGGHRDAAAASDFQPYVQAGGVGRQGLASAQQGMSLRNCATWCDPVEVV